MDQRRFVATGSAQVHRRVRVDRDVDVRDRVGASIAMVRSLTGIPKVTDPFADRPTRRARWAANAARRVLLVPPSECAGVPLVGIDKDIAAGSVMGSSARAGGTGGLVGSGAADPGTAPATSGQSWCVNEGSADSGDVARGLTASSRRPATAGARQRAS